MSILILRLAGPLQSWGTGSKLADRGTDPYPSKSGVLGMLAAAEGRPRSADMSDLAVLPFGVAVRRPGISSPDTQTAVAGGVSYRGARDNQRYFFHKDYLQDAVFFVGIECEMSVAQRLADALRRPAFPLFLGRRGCPVTQPLVTGIVEGPMKKALLDAVLADPLLDFEKDLPPVRLILEDPDGDMVRDVPVSYDPDKRTFAGRRVKRDFANVQKGEGDVSEQSDS